MLLIGNHTGEVVRLPMDAGKCREIRVHYENLWRQ